MHYAIDIIIRNVVRNPSIDKLYAKKLYSNLLLCDVIYKPF